MKLVHKDYATDKNKTWSLYTVIHRWSLYTGSITWKEYPGHM